MFRSRLAIPVLLGALLLAGCASTPAPVDPSTLQLPQQGAVAVSWNDPARYREFSCRNADFARGDWMRTLAEYTRSQAERRLPAGARLEVRFIDVDRAGECEPGRVGQPLRVLREVTPPRIELDYRLVPASGAERSAQGVVLTDLGYLHRMTSPTSQDALLHEKRLVDTWLRSLLD